MEMYIYKLKDGVDVDSWDDVNYETDCEVCAVVIGESNSECESKAIDEGFGDTDIYGWTYENFWENQSSWGGQRKGAGRKPTGRKGKFIYVTDEELEKVKEYIEKLRSQE